MSKLHLGFGVARLAILFLCASLALAQGKDKRLKRIESRLNELEDLTSEIEEKTGSRALVQTYSAESLDLGGHLTSIWAAANGEEASDIGHLATLFELFIRAGIDDKTSLFATPGFYSYTPISYANPRRPKLLGENPRGRNTVLARAYVEHRHSNLFGLQAGFVGTPHGVTNREYFLPSRKLMSSPLHTRVFLANQLYAQQVLGLKLSGSTMIDGAGKVTAEYDIYVGTEDDDPNEAESGVRLAVQFKDLGLTIAGNLGDGSREAFATITSLAPQFNVPLLFSPFPQYTLVRTDYQFYGLDVDLRTESFDLAIEGYISEEARAQNRKAASFQPTWWVQSNIGINYRFDYFDSGMNLGHATEHTLGIVYDYNPSLRIRLDLAHQELPNSPDSVDYALLSFSASF